MKKKARMIFFNASLTDWINVGNIMVKSIGFK